MSFKENIPLNFELLRSPVNWVIVTFMVLIAVGGLAMIFPITKAQD